MPESNGKSVNLNTLPQDEFEAFFQRAFERWAQEDIQKRISKLVQQEWETVAVQDVIRTATEVLGQDYWEVMEIAKSMRHGDFDDPFVVDQALMALGGYYTPISVACAVLWDQHKTEWAKIVQERKKVGDTDSAARARADVACSSIHRNAAIMQNLREATLENINILKKVRDGLITERSQVTKIQADSSAGVRAGSPVRPWRSQ